MKKIELSDVYEWFSVMIDRFSENHNIIFSKTFFNKVTSNYNFEFKIKDSFVNELESINVKVRRDTWKWFPKSVTNYREDQPSYGEGLSPHTFINIHDVLENNDNKDLHIQYHTWRGVDKITFKFGGTITGVKVEKEELEKLISLIENDKVSNIKYGSDKSKNIEFLKKVVSKM